MVAPMFLAQTYLANVRHQREACFMADSLHALVRHLVGTIRVHRLHFSISLHIYARQETTSPPSLLIAFAEFSLKLLGQLFLHVDRYGSAQLLLMVQ